MPTLGSFQGSNVLSPASFASFLRFCSGRSAVFSGAGDIARLRVRSRRAVFLTSQNEPSDRRAAKYCDEQDMNPESELRTVNYLSNREYESRASATDLLSRVIRSDIHDLRPLGRVVVRSSDG